MEKSRNSKGRHHNREPPPRCPPDIEIGDYIIDTWYSSPYPQEYVKERIYICEFCLSYMKNYKTLARHNSKCPIYCPPANEIYRSVHQLKDGPAELSIFEADGAKSKLYCQNLCLLAKLFLDHKTLYYDVDHFLFYILTKNDEVGSRIIGYFSKEKHCSQKNNVSCIMILPQYQNYGYGRFLIEFSYLLSKKENTLGTPEKPLSDLGKVSYLNYWKYSILSVIRDKTDVTLKEISEATNMTIEDILYALKHHHFIKKKDCEHIYVREEDFVKLDKPRLTVHPEDLRWTQYVSRYAKRMLREIEEEKDIEQETTDEEQEQIDVEKIEDGVKVERVIELEAGIKKENGLEVKKDVDEEEAWNDNSLMSDDQDSDAATEIFSDFNDFEGKSQGLSPKHPSVSLCERDCSKLQV